MYQVSYSCRYVSALVNGVHYGTAWHVLLHMKPVPFYLVQGQTPRMEFELLKESSLINPEHFNLLFSLY